MNQPTIIAKQQRMQRWDMLPPALREALVSEKNSEILWQTCVVEHLSEEKTREVARIAGWVMMGFLHPEDVASEIKFSIGVHPEIASKIAATLTMKIFAPIRAELDSIYAPPGTEPHYKEAAAPPVVLEDVRHPEAVDETLQKIQAGSPAGEPFFKETPSFVPPPPEASDGRGETTAGKPVTLEAIEEQATRDKGQGTFEGPTFDVPPEFVPPPSASGGTPAFFSPESSTPVPSDSLTPKTSNLEPTPFILHEEPAAPSLPRVEDFSLNIKPEEFGPSEPEMEKIPQADIEIGGPAGPDSETKTSNLKPNASPERTVHYGDLRTPLEGVNDEGKGTSGEGRVKSDAAIPPLPLSAVPEPAPAPRPAFETLNLSDLAGPAITSTPKVEPSADQGSTLEAPKPAPPPPPKKSGFFARLFGRKTPSADQGGLDSQPAKAEEAPTPANSRVGAPTASVGGSTLETALKSAAPEPDAPPPPPPTPPAPETTSKGDNNIVDLGSL